MSFAKEDEMRTRARKIGGAVLVIAVLPAVCRAGRGAAAPTRPARVVVSRVAPAEAGREFAYSGTMAESETLPQGFAVAGTVTRVHVNEGDVVARGALLAELDDANFRQAA